MTFDILFEVNQFGIHNYTLILILLLPIISTIVSISRHIVGMKTLSLYAPIVLTYAFIEMGMTRIPGSESFEPIVSAAYGIIFYIVVLATSTGLYRITKRLRVNYYSKMSLIFSGIASAVMLVYFLAAWIGDTNLINISIFSIVLVAAIAERLVARYARTDFRSTVFLSLETLILALVGLLIFSIPQFQILLLTNSWVIVVIVVINFLVGTFRGLRLSEYVRFHSILDKDYNKE